MSRDVGTVTGRIDKLEGVVNVKSAATTWSTLASLVSIEPARDDVGRSSSLDCRVRLLDLPTSRSMTWSALSSAEI